MHNNIEVELCMHTVECTVYQHVVCCVWTTVLHVPFSTR